MQRATDFHPIDTPERAARARAALAEAFDGYPLTEWIVPRDAHYARRLDRYVDAMMSASLDGGHCLVDAEGRGAILWRAPDAPPLGAGALLRQGKTLPGILGARRLASRIPGLLRLARDHPSERHAYLVMLGVRPEHHRAGLGQALLRPGLTHFDALGIGSFLHTANVDSIPFYRAHGFEVQGEPMRISGGPDVWRLGRPPGSLTACRLPH